jgi:large subunit ribosomal protein L18e
MGIDLKAGGRRVKHNIRTAPVSKNVYIKLLEKLYRWVLLSSFKSFRYVI